MLDVSAVEAPGRRRGGGGQPPSQHSLLVCLERRPTRPGLSSSSPPHRQSLHAGPPPSPPPAHAHPLHESYVYSGPSTLHVSVVLSCLQPAPLYTAGIYLSTPKPSNIRGRAPSQQRAGQLSARDPSGRRGGEEWWLSRPFPDPRNLPCHNQAGPSQEGRGGGLWGFPGGQRTRGTTEGAQPPRGLSQGRNRLVPSEHRSLCAEPPLCQSKKAGNGPFSPATTRGSARIPRPMMTRTSSAGGVSPGHLPFH